MEDVKHDDLTQMKAKLKAMEDENADLKAKMMEHEHPDKMMDDDCKDKNAKGKKSRGSVRAVEMERDNFARELATQKQNNTDMRADLLAERYGRTLDEMGMQGYRLGDTAKRAALLDEIVASADPDDTLEAAKTACDAKLNFMKGYIAKDPTGMRINQDGARLTTAGSGNEVEKYEREAQAADRARDRCTAEQSTDPATFGRYYAEELKTG